MDECLSRTREREIRRSVKATYRAVAETPRGKVPYPVGRASAKRFGYRAEWLAGVPATVLRRFLGVGNPFAVRPPRRGERVLDVGCGCGLDAFVASRMVGPEGRVVGLDFTAEMVRWPRAAAKAWPLGNLTFRVGSAERLPFADAAFDEVISNGVLNLVPDKDAAFQEIARVLRPGGVFAAADLLVVDTVPDEVLADLDAWAG
jgi:SAM-dependent methyltransferase